VAIRGGNLDNDIVLYLLVTIGLIGGFDTIYYHEWRARLPVLGRSARSELRLHALRDFVYAILFCTLPWLTWHGVYVVALTALLVIEIILTLWDFVVEDWVRKPLGGLYPGERIMHGVMGIAFGAMLAYLVPLMVAWWHQPTGLVRLPVLPYMGLRWIVTAMAGGVLISGIRDSYAAIGVRGSAWPWKQEGPKS
jgi:hypothetical protein